MSFQNPLPPGIRQVVPDYVSDGTQTVFSFPFRLWNAADLWVGVAPPTQDNAPYPNGFAQLALNADYTVAIAANSASVTLAAPQPAGQIVRLMGDRTPSRTTSVVNDGVVQSGPLESELDVIEATLQELRRDAGAAFTVMTNVASAANSAAAAAASAADALAAASTAAAIAATNWGVWATRNAFRLATIAAGVGAAVMLGVAASGDCDAHTLVRLGSTPSPAQPWHFQSADGAWWILKCAEIDARIFGADPTQTLDSTSAINNACAYAGAIGGGKVRLRGGRYKISGTLAISQSGVSVDGDGPGSTYLIFGSGTADGVTISGASYASFLTGAAFSNLYLDFTARTGGRAIYTQFLFWPIFQNLIFNGAQNGIEFWSTNSPAVTNVLFQGVRNQWAIYWHNAADGSLNFAPQLTLTTVIINANYSGADGIWLDGAVSTLNMNLVVCLDTRVGLWIKNTAASATWCPNFVIAYQFVTDGQLLRGLQIDGGRQMHFDECWIQNTSTPTAIGPGTQGFNDQEAVLIGGDIGVSYTSDIFFNGGRIGNSKTRAATINGARNIKFNDLLFEPGGKGSPGAYEAVYVGASSQDVSILGCDFSTWGDPLNWSYGVTVAAGALRVIVDDCNVWGVATGAVQWLTNDANSYAGKVLTANGITNQNGGVAVPNSVAVSGSFTLTAAQLLGGVLQFAAGASGAVATLPTAAQIVAGLDAACRNKCYSLLLINSTAYSITLSFPTGVTASGNLATSTTITIPAASQRSAVVQIGNPTPGSEAVTVWA